jgi:uncharacterized protein (DUF2384 family)
VPNGNAGSISTSDAAADCASADADGLEHLPAWLIGPFDTALSDVGRISRSLRRRVEADRLSCLEVDDELVLCGSLDRALPGRREA